MITTIKCPLCGWNTAAFALGLTHQCKYTPTKRKLFSAKWYLVNTYGFESEIDSFTIFSDAMHRLVVEEINTVEE